MSDRREHFAATRFRETTPVTLHARAHRAMFTSGHVPEALGRAGIVGSSLHVTAEASTNAAVTPSLQPPLFGWPDSPSLRSCCSSPGADRPACRCGPQQLCWLCTNAQTDGDVPVMMVTRQRARSARRPHPAGRQGRQTMTVMFDRGLAAALWAPLWILASCAVALAAPPRLVPLAVTCLGAVLTASIAVTVAQWAGAPMRASLIAPGRTGAPVGHRAWPRAARQTAAASDAQDLRRMDDDGGWSAALAPARLHETGRAL
jgi:hypothetical protein